jgi:hypothetical protein
MEKKSIALSARRPLLVLSLLLLLSDLTGCESNGNSQRLGGMPAS